MTTLQTNRMSTYLIALGAFALGMDSYMTAGLMPMIEKYFLVSTAMAAQLVTAFTLGYGLGSPIFVAILPPAWQRFGLIFALGLFTMANVACALANSITTLLIFRAVAGMGAGVYLALGIAAAASLATDSWRGKNIALIMGGMASGTVLGVPASLLLAKYLGWQVAFFLVTALATLSFTGLVIQLPLLPKAQALSFRDKLSVLHDKRVLSILFVSLVAAISSLGMYTFIAPFITTVANNTELSVIPFLWSWGVGGIVGSFLVGSLVDKMEGSFVTLMIMIALTLSLLALPLCISVAPWSCLIPLVTWGAVGWALQVPQNNELLKAREARGDGNLAVALNESALYLGSAIGAATGGGALLLGLPLWSLPIGAGTIAAIGALVQFLVLPKTL